MTVSLLRVQLTILTLGLSGLDPGTTTSARLDISHAAAAALVRTQHEHIIMFYTELSS